MYEQFSLIPGGSPAPAAPTPPQAAQRPAAVKYYPIDENTARRAHEMMSMRDYKPGSATAGYRASVDEAAALVERCKAATSPYYHDKLDALLDRYARRLASGPTTTPATAPAVPAS